MDAFAATALDAVALLDGGRRSDTPEQDGGAPDVGGAEYAGLRARRATLVFDAVTRLGGASPLAGGLDGDAFDDVGQLVDFLAAAVYLSDPDLFAAHMGWLGSVLAAHGVAAAGVETDLDVLQDGLHDFPHAQECLRQGRERLATAGWPDDHGGAAPGRGRPRLRRRRAARGAHLTTVPDLHTVLSDGTAGDPDLVLDVTALTFCDSAGLAAFLGASRRVERRGGRVTPAGARPRLRRMLELTVVESLLSYDGTDRREDGPAREGRSETA